MATTANSEGHNKDTDNNVIQTINHHNNNNNNNSSESAKSQDLAPYVVSLSPKRISRNHILPPLGSGKEREMIHKRSPGGSKSSYRHKTSRKMAANGGTSSSRRMSTSTKRSHSAASQDSTVIASVHGTPKHHGAKSSKLLRSPSRSRHVNRVDTVRVLRARPAFYPVVKDRYSSSPPVLAKSRSGRITSAHAVAAGILASPEQPSSHNYPHDSFSLPHDISGTQMTLRTPADKANEMLRKKKRRGMKTPTAINL